MLFLLQVWLQKNYFPLYWWSTKDKELNFSRTASFTDLLILSFCFKCILSSRSHWKVKISVPVLRTVSLTQAAFHTHPGTSTGTRYQLMIDVQKKAKVKRNTFLRYLLEKCISTMTTYKRNLVFFFTWTTMFCF